MRGFSATFLMGFKYLWRNPVEVTILIVFPIVLILILGSALESYISVETNLDPAEVAVAADQDSMLAEYLQSEDISRFINIRFTDEAGAVELVKEKAVCAAIIDQDGDISVICSSESGFMAEIVLSVVEAYSQMGGAAASAAMRGESVFELLNLTIDIKDIPLGKRVPGAIDYYAVTMLVMILMYTGLNGHDLFNKCLLGETGSRIRLSPISMPAQAGGLLAASTLTSFLQGMVTFVFAGLVYNVYWGERIPLVLLTLFAVVLFSQALCIFVIMLLRHSGAVIGVLQTLIWTMTFVSSGFIKIDFGAANQIFQYVPNAMAHTVIFGAIFGGNERKMVFSLLLLFSFGALLFMLSFLLGRRHLA